VSSLTRAATPLRLALRRVWSRRGRAALAALGAAAGAALLATVLAAALTVSDRTIARGISALPSPERQVAAVWGGVPLQQPRGGFASLDRLARRQLTPVVGRAPTAFALFRETRVAGANVDLAAGDDLARWVKLSSGRLPRTCTPTRCEVVQLAGSGPIPRGFVRVGEGSLVSQQPFGYLLGGQTAGSIIARATRWHRPAAPPFLLAPGVANAARLPQLYYDYRSYRWVVPLKPGDVHPWSLDRVTRRLDEARATVGAVSSAFTVEAPDQELQESLATGRAGQRRLLLLGGEAAALLLAFVILAASGLRRDAEASRRRLTWLGATRSQIALQSGAEAAAIAAVGTAVGWFAGIAPAIGVARHFGSPGGAIVAHSVLSGTGLAVVLALIVATAAILIASVWSPRIQLGGLRLTALDLAAVAAAVVVAVAFARGATDTGSLAGGQGTGAVLLLLPGLVVFIAAVVAARAVGFVSRLLERAGRAGPLTLRLAALSLARNPGRAAVAVSFLVVSLGLAVFAAVYRSTLTQGQRDQAAYAVPPAAIVSEDNAKLVRVLQAAPFSAYRRVGPAAQVIRLSGNVPAGAGFTLLAMPGATLADIGGWRSSFSSSSRQELASRITPSGPVGLRAVPLPPGRLTLPLDANGLVRVRAAIETRDGGFRFVPLPGAQPGGRLLGFSFDLTGRGLEREAISGEGAHPLGTIALTLSPPRVDGKALPVDFTAWTGKGVRAKTKPGSARLRFLATSDLQPAFRVREPLDGRAVPVVVSPAIAAAAGPRRVLPLQIEGTPLLARVVGIATRFPSVDGDFVVADRQTLATAMNADHPGTAVTNEIWLGTPPPAGPPFDVLQVTTRQSVQANLAGDPLSRGSLLALVVASLAGVGLALAGLLLVVVADLRDERGELFDLEAQGATPATLRRHLRLRASMLVGMGLVGGILTGAVLSALVVSLVEVTANATAPQPPLVLSVDWGVLALGLLAYLVASGALVVAATWSAFRSPAAGRFAEVGW
jgi:FtsX-like permease family